LKERGNEKSEIEDEKKLFDLSFLADFTSKLNDMNIELQGKNKCISEMMSKDSSCKSKFEVLIIDLTNNTFAQFPNMQDHFEKYPNFVFQKEKFVNEMYSVILDFGYRF
jgi:hypothetical protein